MSRAAFRVAYDGEALASHTMDVRDLAPALLGLGEVFVEANRILNGRETKLEVRVTPRIEENCFDIGIEVLQYWGTLKELLGKSDITAAKELLDWVVLNKEIVGGTIVGLVYFYRRLRGKKPENVIRFNDENGNPLYRYQFNGEPDQIVDERVHRLYESNKIRIQLGRLFRPLMQREGIEEFVAYEKDKEADGTRLSKQEAREIDFTIPEPSPVTETETLTEPVEAMLRVYSPVYDLNAPRWRFWYGKDHHYMDVSESSIREHVINNGGALIDDRFRVLLQITERENDAGEKVHDFKVLDVLEFIPAFRQPELFTNDQETDDTEGSSGEGTDGGVRS